jgi:HEAT repeat protein
MRLSHGAALASALFLVLAGMGATEPDSEVLRRQDYRALIMQATLPVFRSALPSEGQAKAAKEAMDLLRRDKENVAAYIMEQLQRGDSRDPFSLRSAHYGVVLREFGLEYVKKLEPTVLQSPDERVRKAGVIVLGAYIPPGELRDWAHDMLVEVLRRDNAPSVQASCIGGLWGLQANNERELVAGYLSSEHPEVRRSAIGYLVSFAFQEKHRNPDYRPPDLLDRFKAGIEIEKDPINAFLLSRTVCEHDRSAGMALVTHRNANVRCGALHQLASLSKELADEHFAAVVQRIGAETDGRCKYEMVEILSHRGDTRCIELFIGILKGPDDADLPLSGWGVKATAASALDNLTGQPFRVTAEDRQGSREGRGNLYDGIAEKYDAWWHENKDRLEWDRHQGRFILHPSAGKGPEGQRQSLAAGGAGEATETMLMFEGRSPDDRYEVRITREPDLAPSDYSISIHSVETGKPLFTLYDQGGFNEYATSWAGCRARWHPSSEFVALTDQGTQHTRELYLIGLSDGRFVRLHLPDYVQNALGRVDAAETELYCLSIPNAWENDDLLLTLEFAVANPEPRQERLFYTCDVILHLHRGPNEVPYIKLKSVSSPQRTVWEYIEHGGESMRVS